MADFFLRILTPLRCFSDRSLAWETLGAETIFLRVRRKLEEGHQVVDLHSAADKRRNLLTRGGNGGGGGVACDEGDSSSNRLRLMRGGLSWETDNPFLSRMEKLALPRT